MKTIYFTNLIMNQSNKSLNDNITHLVSQPYKYGFSKLNF